MHTKKPMNYDQIKSLEEYLSTVESELLKEDSRLLVVYPENSVKPWNDEEIDAANKTLLKLVRGVANIYALFTAPKGSNQFALRYIGKTTKELARQRIRNHLIKKDKNTGSKLEEVIKHVQSGGLVKISWVSIEPQSLRNYIEEELIYKHTEANWNRENKRKHIST